MSPHRYHPALRLLHWTIALLILAALVFGTFIMAPTDNADPAKTFMLFKHMAAGATILTLTVTRMLIRPRTKRPAPVRSGIAVADRIVPFVHRVFDLLVLVMAASGVTMAIHAGLLDPLVGGRAVLPKNFDHVPLHALHVLTAKVLAAIIALHVAGALYHQFILRDGLFSRMSLPLHRRQPAAR